MPGGGVMILMPQLKFFAYIEAVSFEMVGKPETQGKNRPCDRKHGFTNRIASLGRFVSQSEIEI